MKSDVCPDFKNSCKDSIFLAVYSSVSFNSLYVMMLAGVL